MTDGQRSRSGGIPFYRVGIVRLLLDQTKAVEGATQDYSVKN